MNRKNLFLLILIFLLFIFFIIEEKAASLFIIRVPIGEIPVPLLFWSGIFTYSLLFMLTMGKNNLHFRNIIVLGLISHFIVLLTRLKAMEIKELLGFTSMIYRLYLDIFFLISSVIFSTFISSLIYRSLIINKKPGFYLGFLAPFLYLAWSMAPHRGYFSVLFVLLFTFALFINRLKDKKNRYFIGILNLRKIVINEKLIIVIIFILALAVRITYLNRTMTDPDYLQTGADGARDDDYAWTYAQGQDNKVAYAAGYWIFLAYIYKIFGHNYFMACLIQSIIGAIACVLIFYLSKIILGNLYIAAIAGFLSAINFSIIFSSISLGHQALDIFLLPLIALLTALYSKDTSNRLIYPIAIAVLSGFSIAVRELNILTVCFIFFIILTKPLLKREYLKTLRICAFLFIFFALGLFPFVYRNYRNLGVIYPWAEKSGPGWTVTGHFEAELSGNKELLDLGINPFAQPIKSIEIFLKEPVKVSQTMARISWRNFLRLYFSQSYGRFDLVFLVRETPYFFIIWLYAFIFTTGSILYIFFKESGPVRAGAFLIFGIVLFKTLPHLFIVANFRYRPPMDLFLIIFCSYGLFEIFFKRIRRLS